LPPAARASRFEPRCTAIAILLVQAAPVHLRVPGVLARAVGEGGVVRDDAVVEVAGRRPAGRRVWEGEGADPDPAGIVRLRQPSSGLLAARVDAFDCEVDKQRLVVHAVFPARPTSSARARSGSIGAATILRCAGVGAALLAERRRALSVVEAAEAWALRGSWRGYHAESRKEKCSQH